MFSRAPVILFKGTRNLKSYLVRYKIYPVQGKVGSENCDSKCCLVCLNVSKNEILRLLQTKEQYKINHQINCNGKCLIYLLSFKVFGFQNVHSTTDKFRFRWSNYKENNPKAKRGEEHTQLLVFEHFSSNDHNGFLEDCTITLTIKHIALIPLEERNTGEEF